MHSRCVRTPGNITLLSPNRSHALMQSIPALSFNLMLVCGQAAPCGVCRPQMPPSCVRCLLCAQAKEVYYEIQAGYGKPSALLLQAHLHSMQEENNFNLWWVS